MKIMKLVSVMLFVTIITSTVVTAEQYETTWESLSKHPIPEWFKDAKFGIYAHLGVYCVPAYNNEWYPSNMYNKSDSPNSVFQYHIRTYGDQSKFGYKDFIPMFKLEKFDPAEWAELYAQAGAKFAGPVAEHHDGFSMWPSKVNRWNAGAMGPKRDVVGELVSEIRKRDMKVVTSFHHAHNFQGYYPNVEGFDVSDPQYADLYGKLGPEASHDRWLAKLKEVIDAYQPDQIWFDFGLQKIPDSFKQEFAAYYYNKEAEWGKPLIITRKGDHLPEGVGVLDIERGRMQTMGQTLWQTDDSTAHNSWSGVQGLRVKPPQEVLHILIDIVSKNGVLMLNVCPGADGTISDDQKKILSEMGQWLKVNGEAIYSTRPWEVYGEGPTQMGRGRRGGSFARTVQYGAEDIRYTRSKDKKILYAITLGWPTGPFTLSSVSVKNTLDNARVEMLGHGQPLKFTVNDDKTMALIPPVLTAEQLPYPYAYAFKLTGFELEANQSRTTGNN
jgi:alpha-L-fucosidase